MPPGVTPEYIPQETDPLGWTPLTPRAGVLDFFNPAVHPRPQSIPHVCRASFGHDLVDTLPPINPPLPADSLPCEFLVLHAVWAVLDSSPLPQSPPESMFRYR